MLQHYQRQLIHTNSHKDISFVQCVPPAHARDSAILITQYYWHHYMHTVQRKNQNLPFGDTLRPEKIGRLMCP